MTETQQSAPETQATPEAAPSIDDRVAELASKLTPTGDDSDYASDSLPANADKKDESEPAKEAKEESTDDPERAARKARREAIRAKQAERNAYVEQRRAQTQQRQQEAPQADIAQMQAELQRLKAVEESLKDPARFFEVAANVGVDPNGLSSWLEKAINDPHAVAAEVAAKRAKEVVSPEIEAVKQELAAMKAFHEQQIQQARIASERAAEAELIAHASKLGESSAVNTWREAFGDSQIIALANACLPELPEGSTMLDLLDLVEERCEFAIQKLTKQPVKQPKKTEQPAQKNISARTRAERTELDDPEAALAGLSVDERVRLLTAQLNNSR